MQSKWMKNLLRLLGFLVGAFALGMAVLLWVGGGEKIADISLVDGHGFLDTPEVGIRLEARTPATGTVSVHASPLRHSSSLFEAADYVQEIAYTLRGEGVLLDGKLTLRLPIPEALRGEANLRQGLRIVTLEPGRNHWNEALEMVRSQMVDVDMEAQTFSTTIQSEGLDGALGDASRSGGGNSLRGVSAQAAPPKGAEMTLKFTCVYYKKAKRLRGKYFYMDGVAASMPTERLKDIIQRLDATFEELHRMGLDSQKVETPVEVRLHDFGNTPNLQFGMMVSSRFRRSSGTLYLNKNLLLQKDLPSEDLETMHSTAAHELFHLVQETHWRQQYWKRFSWSTFMWIDEATATAFEMHVSPNKDHDPSVMRTNMADLAKAPLLLFNEWGKSDKEAESFGYAMAYPLGYLMRDKRCGAKTLADIYKTIAKDGVPPKEALSQSFECVGGAEAFWLDFLQKAVAQPRLVHPSVSVRMDWSQNLYMGRGAGEGTDTHIVFDAHKGQARPDILHSKGKNHIVFETELPNLSMETLVLQLDSRDEKAKALREHLGRGYTVSVEGDEKTGAMIFSYNKGAKGGVQQAQALSSFPNNLIPNGQQVSFQEIDYLYVLLVNHDPDISTLRKRKIKVSFTFNTGENFDGIAPPPQMDALDTEALREMEQWRDFCGTQKQPQQQSNAMLVAYYEHKEKELDAAIKLLREGTNLYTQMGILLRPEKPEDLTQNLEASIQKIETIQDFAFKAKIKLEETLDSETPEVQAERLSYQLSAEAFDQRQVAYWNLLEYLKAVQSAEDVAVMPPSPPSTNSFHLGRWTVRDYYSQKTLGSITLSEGHLSANVECDYKMHSFSSVPYTATFSKFSHEGREVPYATIHIETNYQRFQGGTEAYHCPEGNPINMCFHLSDFMIFKDATAVYGGTPTNGQVSWSYYQNLPQYKDFKQGSNKGKVDR